MRRKASDYGKTWWNCDYCKLSHAILKVRPTCRTCDKQDLDGATPEQEVDNGANQVLIKA